MKEPSAKEEVFQSESPHLMVQLKVKAIMINLYILVLLSPYHTHIILSAPSDYTSLSEVVTFSSSSTIQSVRVTIVDDDLLEIDEVFTASLELVNAVDADRVVLMPASAPVTIFDDDSKYKWIS